MTCIRCVSLRATKRFMFLFYAGKVQDHNSAKAGDNSDRYLPHLLLSNFTSDEKISMKSVA